MKKLAMIALFAFLLPAQAHAAETVLHIAVSIIQCGAMSQMETSCRVDARCCPFLESAAGGEESMSTADLESTDLPVLSATGQDGLIGFMQRTHITE